jgi:hypothetical protein
VLPRDQAGAPAHWPDRSRLRDQRAGRQQWALHRRAGCRHQGCSARDHFSDGIPRPPVLVKPPLLRRLRAPAGEGHGDRRVPSLPGRPEPCRFDRDCASRDLAALREPQRRHGGIRPQRLCLYRDGRRRLGQRSRQSRARHHPAARQDPTHRRGPTERRATLLLATEQSVLRRPLGGADEIYAYSLRNPWRFFFDRSTGDLYAADVGQGAVEKIDIITLGGNYGWRIWEGTHCTGQ